MNRLPLWRASSDLGKRLGPLLEAQFARFGRDIDDSTGNRLLAAGFARFRSSEARDHCSVYVRGPLTLWGFGLLWRGEQAALFVPKRPYGPRLLPPDLDISSVWSGRDLPKGRAPATPDETDLLQTLLADALEALGEYEKAQGRPDPFFPSVTELRG